MRVIYTREHFHCKYHKDYHSYYTRIIFIMILVVTIAGLSYQTSLNLPASPDFLVLMSHLGDLLLHNCPHCSVWTYKANNKVTARSFCQRKRRRTMQNQAEWANITSNIPTHSQTTQYLAHFLPHSHSRVVCAGRTSLASCCCPARTAAVQAGSPEKKQAQPLCSPPWIIHRDHADRNRQHRTEL